MVMSSATGGDIESRFCWRERAVGIAAMASLGSFQEAEKRRLKRCKGNIFVLRE